MFRYNTLDDFKFKNRVVGVRVDINSPIIDGKIVMNQRIKAHSKTILDLVKKGAKVVVLAHQGRAGRDDCVSLSNHTKLIEKEINAKVKFSKDIFSKDVQTKVKELNNGEVLVLENLRFFEDETNLDKKDNLILKLEKLFDYYVVDAFSVAHRKQTSMIGFSKIPLVAGRIMEQEIKGLNNISEIKRPSVYVLGGAKPDDLVEILESNFANGKIDNVVLTGVIGEVALICKGYDLGLKKKFLEEKEFLGSINEIKKLLKKYEKNFVLPKDVAIYDGKKRCEIAVEDLDKPENKKLLDKYLIKDVGSKTVDFAKLFLKNSGSIYFKGPAGDFEDKNFTIGTKGIISAIINSGAFTFMGGGHSVTAVETFAKTTDFSYVSLAGGALVKFLSGHTLPGVEVLEKSFEKNIKHFEDFVVVGSNTVDIGVSAPCEFSQFHIGDKIKIEEDFKTSVGGGGVNVSICLSRLGAKVGYLGKLSNETLPKVKDVLNRDKIDLIESKISKKAGAKSILIDTKDSDRLILTFRGQNSFLETSDFKFEDINAKNFYFSSLAGISFKTQIDLAKKINESDKDSLICYSLTSHLIKTEKRISSLVKMCDVIVLNLEEAQDYTSQNSISNCLKALKKQISSVVVITDGANGAYAYDGDQEYFVKAIKPKKIVDTTGAGDSFAGTFFYYYSKGYGIKKSLEYGAKNSANVISYKGAQDGLLYYEDLK